MCLSTWGFSGRRGRVQKKFKIDGSCELQLQVLPQAQSPRTVSSTVGLRHPQLSPPHLHSFRVQREAAGPELPFYLKPLFCPPKGYNKTNVQTHWLGHWFPKE